MGSTVSIEMNLLNHSSKKHGLELKRAMTYYHRNNWPWGRSTIINTHNGAATVKVSIDRYEPNCADITSLSVVPKERHKGYGRELLQLAEQEARNMGAGIVWLTAVDGEFTLGWYQREGYEIEKHYAKETLLKKKL